jgi:hypothetical protein
VTTAGYVRTYAQWLLNHTEEVKDKLIALRRRYGPEVEEALVLAWKTLNRICTIRFIPFLPSIVETLKADENLELKERGDERATYAIDNMIGFPCEVTSCTTLQGADLRSPPRSPNV